MTRNITMVKAMAMGILADFAVSAGSVLASAGLGLLVNSDVPVGIMLAYYVNFPGVLIVTTLIPDPDNSPLGLLTIPGALGISGALYGWLWYLARKRGIVGKAHAERPEKLADEFEDGGWGG